MKYIKLFEKFNEVEYISVARADGTWEIHMKTPVSGEFFLPKEGTLWTNKGVGYESKEEADGMIRSLQVEPEENEDGID